MKQEPQGGAIRARNRDLIIQAAIQEFAAKGFRGTTVQSIADRAELPKPNVHYYFGNKEALYQEVLANIMSLWDGSLDELNEDDDPSLFIAEYIERKVLFSKENPEASRIFAAEILNGAPHMKAQFGKRYHEWFIGRNEIFKTWQTAGKINASVSPEHLLFIIWAATQHYADYEYQVKAALGVRKISQDQFQQAIDTLTHIVLAGIKP